MTAPLGFEFATEWQDLVRRVWFGDAPAGLVPPGIILAAERPEWEILRSEILLQVESITGALAANFSGVAIRQSVKDRISVIEEVWIVNSGAAAQSYRIGLSFSLPTPITTVKSSPRDGRRGVNFQPSTTLVTYQDGTGFLLNSRRLMVPATTTLILKPARAYVIQPSITQAIGPTNLIVQGHVVNQDCEVIALGYERFLRPEEKYDS